MNNNKQQAVILKGIAQQILSMNMPSINELTKLLKEFDLVDKLPNILVLTTTPQGDKSVFTELPFQDNVRMNYYCNSFYNIESAKSFAENQVNIYSKSSKQNSIVIIDDNYTYNLMVRFGGIIHYVYKCNGREWMIWENPNWLSLTK